MKKKTIISTGNGKCKKLLTLIAEYMRQSAKQHIALALTYVFDTLCAASNDALKLMTETATTYHITGFSDFYNVKSHLTPKLDELRAMQDKICLLPVTDRHYPIPLLVSILADFAELGWLLADDDIYISEDLI